jgi:hypothetical protein
MADSKAINVFRESRTVAAALKQFATSKPQRDLIEIGEAPGVGDVERRAEPQ